MTTATFTPNPDTIYLCDNGAAYCGDHLGISARMTGRDISGQRIMAVTPPMAREYAAEYHTPVRCEQCHKEAAR